MIVPPLQINPILDVLMQIGNADIDIVIQLPS